MNTMIDLIAAHADRAYNAYMETRDAGARRADTVALHFLRELQHAALTPRYPGIATPIEPQAASDDGTPDYIRALALHFHRVDNHLEDLYMRCEAVDVNPNRYAPFRGARNAMNVAEFYTGEARYAYWAANVFKG